MEQRLFRYFFESDFVPFHLLIKSGRFSSQKFCRFLLIPIELGKHPYQQSLLDIVHNLFERNPMIDTEIV